MKTISIADGETGGESFALIFKPHSTQELPQILIVSYNRRNDDKLGKFREKIYFPYLQ